MHVILLFILSEWIVFIVHHFTFPFSLNIFFSGRILLKGDNITLLMNTQPS